MVVTTAFILATLSRQSDVEVGARIKQYMEAIRTYDIATMKSVFHESYLEVSPQGTVEDKGQILKSYDLPAEKRMIADRIELDEWNMKFPRKDIAVTSFRQVYHFRRNDQSFQIKLRVTMSLLKEGKTWMLTSQHIAPLELPRPKKA